MLIFSAAPKGTRQSEESSERSSAEWGSNSDVSLDSDMENNAAAFQQTLQAVPTLGNRYVIQILQQLLQFSCFWSSYDTYCLE